MPPKKGKKGKADKKAKKEETPDGGEEIKDKETLLQEELVTVTDELEKAKEQTALLKQENDWLQQEAHTVRIESHEYMNYMQKKTSRRQTTIITLSDQNQKEIYDLMQAKQNMLNEYEDKKNALRETLMEKENLLAKTKKELEDLQEFKNLQIEQSSRIKELEKEVSIMRGKHSDAIMQLKSRFLKEKREYLHDAASKVVAMAKEANQEAAQCLTEHTHRIKLENRRLRHQLLMLIQQTRALHEHKDKLLEQRRQLQMEQQYARDLKTLRTARQHKVFKSFGLLDDSKPANEMEEEAA
ncbi:hypothetical protein LSAT2_013993 [Lamellibrachia satsuma]|nr:hypothetical protein LSAT2_021324 [Lamellibrachia satsuma]KAI0235481.1 hypothetical protein LSAT2_013993 [Lamellibrachia satsuma]